MSYKACSFLVTIILYMKKIYLLPVLILCMFYSCSDLEDDYSTNPNHTLAFSTDTLAFDTVFTTVGSTTKKIMVYNRNKEALNIESIALSGKGNTGFRINVDGKKGSEFDNVGILAKDSMYIFVEVTVDPRDKNNPFELKDSLVFSTNGVRQYVLLQAFGQDAHIIKGGLFIERDTTFTGERPYLVYDSIEISPNVTLTIESGASFYLHNNAIINVYGTIQANGTLERPVLFRGDRLDDLLPGRLAYDNTPGQWGGFTFYPESYNNLFNHVIVRNGKNGITCLPSTTDQPKIFFRESQVTNMSGNLLFAENCHIEASNSEFTNAEDNVIALSGGKYHFIHCTIGNFMSMKARTGSAVVNLLHNIPNSHDQTYPIEQAYFDNCIIDGSKAQKSGEIKIETSEDFNYRFKNCYLMQTEPEKKDFYINCLFGERLNYLKTGKEDERYTFDFRPQLNAESKSPVIGAGDIETARLYPQDRYGVTRVSESIRPDIGAYQYVPEPEE